MIYVGDWGFVYNLTTNISTRSPTIKQIDLFLVTPARQHFKRTFLPAELATLPPNSLLWRFEPHHLAAPGQYWFEAFVTYQENPLQPTQATAGRTSSPWRFDVALPKRLNTAERT